MGAVTPNLKLNVPEFDQSPWDQDVNTNWLVLDAAVGMFTAIPNLVGVWKNSTSYLYGQSVIDAADSSIWVCVQTHTSSAIPATFPVERAQYPARWTQTVAGAQFYATQAATSAANAAASAASAQLSAASVGSMLPTTGGTMTGALILYGDPVNMLEPATRQYVDARVGGVGYLPIGGGTLTGSLTVGGAGITYSGEGANAHAIMFGWNGSIVAAIDGTYVGNLALQSYVSNNYLPISGGTLSGSLVVIGEVQTTSIYRINLSGAYFYSTSGETLINWDSGNWSLRYNRSNGTLTYRRSDGLNLFTIDGGGNASVAANFNVGAVLATAGNSHTRGGTAYWGAGDRSRLSSDNSTYTNVYMLDNYCWNLNWSTGALAWFRYDNSAVFTISVGGNTWAAGSASANGNVNAGADVHAAGTLYAVNDHMLFGNGAAGRIMQVESNWYWSWNNVNGDMNWVTPNGTFFEIRNHDALCGNDLGAMYGIGGYINASDERLKMNIQPSTYGLAEITQLEPIEFSRQAHPDRVEHGFSAQQVRRIMPHAVAVIGTQEEEPTLGITLDPIVAGLVNAVKTIIERLDQQESTSGTTTH